MHTQLRGMYYFLLPKNVTTNSLPLTASFTDNISSQLTHIVFCMVHLLILYSDIEVSKKKSYEENHKEEKTHLQYLLKKIGVSHFLHKTKLAKTYGDSPRWQPR